MIMVLKYIKKNKYAIPMGRITFKNAYAKEIKCDKRYSYLHDYRFN